MGYRSASVCVCMRVSGEREIEREGGGGRERGSCIDNPQLGKVFTSNKPTSYNRELHLSPERFNVHFVILFCKQLWNR